MFAIVEVPSNLGLRPSGVERLPQALLRAGLASRLAARRAATVLPPGPYDPTRSEETRILNGPALRETSQKVAECVAEIVLRDDIPIVLAGDCSVILGALLGTKTALRKREPSGDVGLLFIDGHVDFYQPEASPTGEVADMDLAIATGRGTSLLTSLDGPPPLIRDENVAAVGARDAEERARAGSQDIGDTAIAVFELPEIRRRGIEAVTDDALKVVCGSDAAAFWCHIDADVLDDSVMPAVDYRQPGGMRPEELTHLLRRAIETNRMAGVSVAIYNPLLDSGGEAARVLVDAIVSGVGPR